jgi:hypothetical protein
MVVAFNRCGFVAHGNSAIAGWNWPNVPVQISAVGLKGGPKWNSKNTYLYRVVWQLLVVCISVFCEVLAGMR